MPAIPSHSDSFVSTWATRLRHGGLLKTARWATAAACALAASVTGVTTARADEPLWSEVVEAATLSAPAAPMCGREGGAQLDALDRMPLVGPPLPASAAWGSAQWGPAGETTQALAPVANGPLANALLAAAHPLLADRFELAEVEAILRRWDANLTEARDPTRCALD